jgi:V/A-type H+-transporting ATPase subunit I
MSIVRLVKTTIYGPIAAKDGVLEDLQSLGCMHVVDLAKKKTAAPGEGPTRSAREALAFLLTCRHRRRQSHQSAGFDPVAVELETLTVKAAIAELEDEKDSLNRRIADVQPWGEFQFRPLDDPARLRLWFYLVPHYQMDRVRRTDLAWKVVRRDNRHCHVVVLSDLEPEGMPVERIHIGDRSLSELERRLEEVELELEDLRARRAGLTRWCDLFAQSLDRLADLHELNQVRGRTLDQDPLFAIQGWTPQDQEADLRDFAERRRLALTFAEPASDEEPPTFLDNPPMLRGGQSLTSFYMTPGYWVWDPSSVVFFSFSIFFSMILSDAGYAAVLALGLAMFWRRLGRSDSGLRLRPLFATMVAASLLWGGLVGSYFGVAPEAGTPLAGLVALDLQDYGTMMRLSIGVGIVHLILAHLADAWRRRNSAAALAPCGWILIMLGAVALWAAHGAGPGGSASAAGAGYVVMGIGALGVLLFSAPQFSWGKRALRGLLALTRVTNAFGDVLSYLRLFALGLASASLALAFNNLATGVRDSVPGLGQLFALLVLLLGHALNFALGIVSGFVHGLRLNFIEFFNWSVTEEGKPFRAFERKEKRLWNPSP